MQARVLTVLVVVYVLNLVDRNLMSILLVSVKRDLGVSDSLMGLLVGPAFAVLYTVAGIPVARLADRHSRRLVLVDRPRGLEHRDGGVRARALVRADGVRARRRGHRRGICVAVRVLVDLGRLSARAAIVRDRDLPLGREHRDLRRDGARRRAQRHPRLAQRLPGRRTARRLLRARRSLLAPRAPPRRGRRDRGFGRAARALRGAALPAAAALVPPRTRRGEPLFDHLVRHDHLVAGVHGARVRSVAGEVRHPAGSGDRHRRRDRRANRPASSPTRSRGATRVGWSGSPQPAAWRCCRASLPSRASPTATLALLALFPANFFNAWFPSLSQAVGQGVAKLRMRALASAIVLFAVNIVGLGLGPWLIGISNDLLAPTYGERGDPLLARRRGRGQPVGAVLTRCSRRGTCAATWRPPDQETNHAPKGDAP